MTDEAIEAMRDLTFHVRARSLEIRALALSVVRALEGDDKTMAVHLLSVVSRLAAEANDLGEKLELAVSAVALEMGGK